MSNFVPTTNQLGIPNIYNTSTTQANPLGTIITAYDQTLGGGEFIYLLGVASTVVGNTVTYSTTTYQTTLSPNTAQNVNPIAVAMSANVASQYGWYQISGLATVKKTAVQVLPNAKIFQSGTAGRWFTTSTAGMHIIGARGANLTTVTSTTSTFVVLINRPSQTDQLA
jgi:hypothetical protein